MALSLLCLKIALASTPKISHVVKVRLEVENTVGQRVWPCTDHIVVASSTLSMVVVMDMRVLLHDVSDGAIAENTATAAFIDPQRCRREVVEHSHIVVRDSTKAFVQLKTMPCLLVKKLGHGIILGWNIVCSLVEGCPKRQRVVGRGSDPLR